METQVEKHAHWVWRTRRSVEEGTLRVSESEICYCSYCRAIIISKGSYTTLTQIEPNVCPYCKAIMDEPT
jgi:rubrerythrin